MSRSERGFRDELSASHSFGNCIPFRMRIPGCAFRLKRHPETASQSESEFWDGFSALGDVDAGHGRLQSDRHRICIGLKLCAENPRICFANPHRLRPPAGVLARSLQTLTRFPNARALHRVRFSAGGGDPSARDTAGCHPVGIESISSRGFARRIRVFASRTRTGFGRLPASSPARYKRFAFA